MDALDYHHDRELVFLKPFFSLLEESNAPPYYTDSSVSVSANELLLSNSAGGATHYPDA